MKNLFSFLVLSLGAFVSSYGQEIIPFPDLSESHIAVYNQKEVFDDHNYSLFTKDYQVALMELDNEITELDNKMQSESNDEKAASLASEKIRLEKKRANLLEEAELMEDLQKFY